MAGAVIELTEQSFEQEVLKADIPVVVDMWAPWCGPCRMVAPVLDELSGTFNGKVKVTKLNVDEHAAVAGKFSVMNIPTLVFFKNGEEVDRVVGVVPKEELSKRFETLAA